MKLKKESKNFGFFSFSLMAVILISNSYQRKIMQSLTLKKMVNFFSTQNIGWIIIIYNNNPVVCLFIFFCLDFNNKSICVDFFQRIIFKIFGFFIFLCWNFWIKKKNDNNITLWKKLLLCFLSKYYTYQNENDDIPDNHGNNDDDDDSFLLLLLFCDHLI